MILKFEDIPGLAANQPQAKHRVDRVVKKTGSCQHTHIQVIEEDRKVFCATCEKEVDSIDALLMIARGLWWKKQTAERELEIEERRVSKVQRAAVEHLYKHGITPDEYRIRWEKEDAKAKAIAQVTELPAPITRQSEETAS